MKMKIIRLLGMMVFSLTAIEALSQTAVLNYIDVQNYPNIKASFRVKDGAGNEIRNFSVSDVIINENGKVRTPNTGYPYCSELMENKFSAILLFDVSNSMQKGLDGSTSPLPGSARWEIVVDAMKDFISQINPDSSECALIQFSSQPKIIKWFTNNKDSLINLLVLGTSGITLGIGTNYNGAFIIDRSRDSTKSALWVAKSAKYKPVIFLITDGGHESQWGGFTNPPTGDGSFFIGDVMRIARERNIRVFVIKVGNDILTGTNSGYLSNLASIEGDIRDNLYMDVMSKNSLTGIFDKFLQMSGTIDYPPPCEVIWKSECTGGGELQLNFPNDYNLTVNGNFAIPAEVKPALIAEPGIISFSFTDLSPKDTTVKITARQNFVEVNQKGFNTSDSRYTIIDWGAKGNPPFTLQKDESVILTIRYSPTDLEYSIAEIDIDGSDCSGGRIKLDAYNPTGVNEIQNINETTIESITPNPASDRILVNYNLSEKGLIKAWVSDILGNKKNEVISTSISSGEHSFEINVENYPDGVYYIIMQTPLKVLKSKFLVVK